MLERPYTAVSVAKFIGWMESATEPQRKVVDALAALAFVEEGSLTEAVFEDLTTT